MVNVVHTEVVWSADYRVNPLLFYHIPWQLSQRNALGIRPG